MPTPLWTIGLAIIATSIGSFGPIFLKKASGSLLLKLSSLLDKNLILGVLFYALGTIIFIPALKYGELSVLYPLVALVYVWVSFLSVKMLKEKMTGLKWIGVLLIIIGVSLIGLGSRFAG